MQTPLVRFRRLLGASAVALGSLLTATAAHAQIPTSLTFFGDSFLDTGNGDILSTNAGFGDLTPSPPYYPGRATNGLTWGDFLAVRFGHANDATASLMGGRNYAIGTATTGTTGFMGLPVGMLSQYGMFTTSGTAIDPNGLYVLFGGANDILNAAQNLSPFAQEAALQTAVGNLAFIASGLYAQGARHFLIPNLPDIGKSPVGLAAGPLSLLLTADTQRFNLLLSQQLAVLQGAFVGATVASLNLNVLFNNVLVDVAQGGPRYGFTNATVPCLLAPVPCSTAVFADQLHPTSQADMLIANAAYTRIVTGADVTAVPEPATFVMVGAGMLLVGVLRRRNA